jgi:hypothetical protein
VPSEQLVLVTVPAVESIVVVPAALQFHEGDVAKFAAHCVASTLTDGGKFSGVQVQTFAVQVVVRQSEPTLQALPVPHLGQPPPQSTSVSVPSFVPFVLQPGAVHICEIQLLFWQSAPVVHPWPFGHLFGHVLPQSTPVSVPFLTVSLHVGAWQVLEMQFADVQSVLLAQPWPFGHLLGQVLPQSVPVSVPFLIPSVHDGV